MRHQFEGTDDEASELDWMESMLEQLGVQRSIGMAIAGNMKGIRREKSEIKVRLQSPDSLQSVPLNPNPPKPNPSPPTPLFFLSLF